MQGTDTQSHPQAVTSPDHPSADFTQSKAESLRHPYPAQLSCHSLLLAWRACYKTLTKDYLI